MREETRKRWTLVVTILGLALSILDSTAVNVALPSIERDLGAGLAGQQWIVDGYLLALAALILIGGSLGDLFGRRRVFVLGLAGFGAASLLCAVSVSTGMLVGARIVQGAFAALMVPGTLALIAAAFPEAERGAAIGAWAGWSGVAAAIGPLAGGALVQAASWRWIFLINLPVIAVAIALSLWAVRESRDEAIAERRIDAPGALLAALGLGGTVFALIEGPGHGWPAGSIAAGAVGLAALAGFVMVELRSPYPMVPLSLFHSRNFSAANLTTLMVYAALTGNFFFLAIYLQTVLGYEPLAAGAALLPVTAVMLLGSSRAGKLGDRIGPRLPMTVGPLVAAGGLAWMALLRPGDAYATSLLAPTLVFGAGLVLTVAPLTTAVMDSVEARRVGIASAINNAVSRTAGLLAIAALGALLAVQFRATLADRTDGQRLGPAERAAVSDARIRPTAGPPAIAPAGGGAAGLQPALRAASVDAFQLTTGICAALCVAGGLVAFAGIRNPRAPAPAHAVCPQAAHPGSAPAPATRAAEAA